MLHWIRIENIAVVESLELDLTDGLNLLTGETGAGKSILIDALGLVLGARASSDRLRTGSDQGFVEAGFFVGTAAPLVEKLAEANLPFDEEENELIIRRELNATGRSKVVVNGRAANAAILRELAPFLADIHGQGDNATLLDPEIGLELLDRFGGIESQRRVVAEAFDNYSKQASQFRALSERLGRQQEQEQQLRFELSELDELAPQEGEDEALERERDLLAHSESRRELAAQSYAALYEHDGAVLSNLGGLFRNLDTLTELDPGTREALEARESILSQLEDLSLFLRDYEANIETSPERLAQVEDRLSLLERAKKRYGAPLEGVLQRQKELRTQLSELDSGDEHLETSKAELEKAAGHYWQKAHALSKSRAKTGKSLEAAVAKELPDLALEKASIKIVCDRLATQTDRADWSRSGVDRMRLLFSANPGEELRSLEQVASGGELSRFMLALKVVSSRDEPPKTLVFDEIDTGISGRVSHAVGEKLKEVAAHHQVVCVTHQPQIASFAGAHYRVDKLESKGRTQTSVQKLDEASRIDEVARMLAGASITETAREHATRLVSTNAK